MSALKSLSVTSAVFMTVFILGIVSAQNELELSPQSDSESMEEIQELLRNVQVVFEMKLASKGQRRAAEEDEEVDDENDIQIVPNACSCQGLKCSCCKFITISKLKFKENCCLSVTYLPRNYGILVSLTAGSRSLFSKEISARNPPPVCVGIPYVKKGGSVCIQFYNLNVGKKTLSGCARFLARLLFVTVAKIDLGCFRMNFLNDTQQVEAVELPYLDVQPALAEGPEPLYLGEVGMEKIKPSEYKKNKKN